MSVMEELQKHAGSNEPAMPRFDEGNESQGRMMEMMSATSIPGQSLTQDPDQKMPWETPPQFDDLQDYVDHAFLDISDPERLPTLLDALRHDAPLEYLVEAYLQNDVTKGKIDPDMMMLALEPVCYIMITMATYGGIDPNFAEDIDVDDDDEDFNKDTQELRMKANGLLAGADKDQNKRISVEEMQAPAVQPKSLLARSKKAVDAVKGEY